jgi:rhodanese-related sulfurtransferase
MENSTAYPRLAFPGESQLGPSGNGCNPLLFTVLASQTRGHAMNFFVEAKHPHDGGMVLVLCRTRGEALQAIANLKKEGYVDVKATDSSGSVVQEGDDFSEHR